MTAYIQLSTGDYPRHPGDIERDGNPDDYAEVKWMPPPKASEGMVAVEGAPQYTKGRYQMTWVVIPLVEAPAAEGPDFGTEETEMGPPDVRG